MPARRSACLGGGIRRRRSWAWHCQIGLRAPAHYSKTGHMLCVAFDVKICERGGGVLLSEGHDLVLLPPLNVVSIV